MKRKKKKPKFCLRCGKEMRRLRDPKDPTKYIYVWRCRCFSPEYYTT